MRSSRLALYCGAALLSGLFTSFNFYSEISSHDRDNNRPFFLKKNDLRPPYGPPSLNIPHIDGQHQLNNDDEFQAQSNTPKDPSPVAVAPWTNLERAQDGRTAPRSFVFANTKVMISSDYAINPTRADKHEHKKIQTDLEKRLCQRSEKLSGNSHAALKCKQNVEILQCMTCFERDGMWYSAVSETAAVFGKVSNGTSSVVHFPDFNDGPYPYKQLDIAVPISGQDDKLAKFAVRLGRSIKKFRSGLYGSKIGIRLLVTRFTMDVPSLLETGPSSELYDFQMNLTRDTGLKQDEIIFVPVNATAFNRAKAINAIHREVLQEEGTALAVMDVDLSIGPKFLRNAITYPFPGASAYFPIMWSAYNPEAVELVDKFIPRVKNNYFSEHHGYWRRNSYGMYVIAGSDAPHLSMNEKFVGWGGEDDDFFARVSKKLNVIRAREKGLTHIWHSKECTLGDFVGAKYFRACVGAMSHVEGSQLGLYLLHLKETNRTALDDILKTKTKNKHDKGNHTSEEDGMMQASTSDEESRNILIGIVSSRKNFGTRVKGIMKTWGDPSNVPEETTIRVFVGAPPEDSDFYGKPEEDVVNLAKIAGIEDLSTIVVMNDVVDDEYPPVRKNSAMIARLDKIAQSFEDDTEAPFRFQWIYKVDDDAYVNFGGLMSFLKTRHADGYHVYGERGFGRKEDKEGLSNGGLVKPYCTGGPGYIMSRQMVKDTAPSMMECVRNAYESEYRNFVWHSDSVIGICIYNSTGAGCWDDQDYQKNRIFRHNLKKEDPFPKESDLPIVIATHPFKDAISMEKQHDRYVHLASSLSYKK